MGVARGGGERGAGGGSGRKRRGDVAWRGGVPEGRAAGRGATRHVSPPSGRGPDVGHRRRRVPGPSGGSSTAQRATGGAHPYPGAAAGGRGVSEQPGAQGAAPQAVGGGVN